MALISTRAKWRSSPSGWSSARQKVLDSAGVVRDAMFQQLAHTEIFEVLVHVEPEEELTGKQTTGFIGQALYF
jgi:hypothetical protein